MTQVLDLELAPDHTLRGQVVDASGRPLADVKVGLVDGKDSFQVSKTDPAGSFTLADVRGGAYRLVAADAHQLVRVWAPGTAPPAAQQATLLVVNQPIVRGQQCNCGSTTGCSECVGPGQVYGGRPVLNWMRNNPGLVVAGVAAAVAIPVAIAASDDDDPSS
jgi:hypothetical protein